MPAFYIRQADIAPAPDATISNPGEEKLVDLPALDQGRLPEGPAGGNRPRYLLLYGSARPGSQGQLLMQEAARLLEHLGGEARVFDPAGLALPDSDPTNAKAAELRELLAWSDAQVWCSPENYGSISAVFKAQLDSGPPVVEGKPVYAGKPLAVIQISAVMQTFNTSNTLAGIGRWLGMLVTPAQLTIAKIQEEFVDGRMKPSPHYDKLVDLVEELHKLTVLLRDHRGELLNRYSARPASN